MPATLVNIIRLIAVIALAATAGCSAEAHIDGERLAVPTPPPAPTPTPTLSETFDEIVDSIVFIEADETTGTGIVADGGWVLTNAHVVERLAEVRVSAGDGTDLGNHPVHATDWLLDLALVGPIESAALKPFDRSPEASMNVGDTAMLIGFPDESNDHPTPTLTSGIVSRRRTTAVGDFPFLQVDATIAPGQSGGALVDLDGNLLGMSGLQFGAGEFGLVFEAEAMWRRVDQLIAHGTDQLPTTPTVNEITGEVGPVRTLGFVVEVGESGQLEMQATSDDDIYIDVQNLSGLTFVADSPHPDPFVSPPQDGLVLFTDDQLEGTEFVFADVPPGTYQVVIGSFGESPEPVTVTSTNPLRRFDDIEEGAELPVGEIVEGQVDWSGDSDRWLVTFAAGDRVVVTADGIADVVAAVRLDGEIIAAGDDDQLGLLGYGTRFEFTAPETAEYELEVGSFDDARWGYLIEVAVE